MNRKNVTAINHYPHLLSVDAERRAVELSYIERLHTMIAERVDPWVMKENLSDIAEIRSIEESFLVRLRELSERFPGDPEWLHDFLDQVGQRAVTPTNSTTEPAGLLTWEEALARSTRR